MKIRMNIVQVIDFEPEQYPTEFDADAAAVQETEALKTSIEDAGFSLDEFSVSYELIPEAGDEEFPVATDFTKHTSTVLRNVKFDEPIFVLRAQDELAPETIAYWNFLAQSRGTPYHKLVGAMQVGDAMRNWSGIKKLPD